MSAQPREFGTHDPIELDEELAGLGSSNDLDDLAAELTATVTPTITLRVESRPGYAVRYRTDFTGKDLDLLRKRAKDKRMTDGVDGVKFGALLLGFTCQAIVRHGEDVELDGKTVTFSTRGFQQLYGADGVDSTVRAFYGLEGLLDGAARRLMVEAGWGDEADVADPTE